MKRRLYHYTCDHGARGLGKRGWLEPGSPLLLGTPVVWLTDLPRADRAGLGLTSNILQCDRTKFRYVVMVEEDEVEWWPLSPLRLALPVQRFELELDRGRQPTHWYVSRQPLRAFRPF